MTPKYPTNSQQGQSLLPPPLSSPSAMPSGTGDIAGQGKAISERGAALRGKVDKTINNDQQTIQQGEKQIEQKSGNVEQNIEAEKGGSVNIRAAKRAAKEIINTPKEVADYLSKPAAPNKGNKPQITNGEE